jgi:hypothetical protein
MRLFKHILFWVKTLLKIMFVPFLVLNWMYCDDSIPGVAWDMIICIFPRSVMQARRPTSFAIFGNGQNRAAAAKKWLSEIRWRELSSNGMRKRTALPSRFRPDRCPIKERKDDPRHHQPY